LRHHVVILEIGKTIVTSAAQGVMPATGDEILLDCRGQYGKKPPTSLCNPARRFMAALSRHAAVEEFGR
jgi:hypothetical protein